MRPTRTGIYGLCAICGMIAYFLLLTLPKAGERIDWRESPDLTLYQSMGAALFIFLNFCWTRGGVARNDLLRVSTLTDKLLLAFFAFALFGATLSVLPLRTIQYVVVTFLVFAAATHVWRIPDFWRRWAFGFLLVGINVFCFVNLYVFGIGAGRYVGQMSPNHFADILITGLMLGYLSGSRYSRLLIVPTYVCIYAVGSRGSFGALTVFLLIFHGLRWAAQPLSRRVRLLYFSLAVIGAASAYTMYDSSWLGSDYFQSFVAWNDVGRDVADLSGRVYLWDEALARVQDNPLLGYGFRTSMELINSHNAYLNLATEVGIPATALFVFLVIYEAVRKARFSFRRDIADAALLDEARVITAIIGAVLLNAIVEVHLVNVGFPLPLLFIIALSDRRYAVLRKAPAAQPARAYVMPLRQPFEPGRAAMGR